MKSTTIRQVLVYIVLVLFALLSLFPGVWMIITSLPKHFMLDNYVGILRESMIPKYFLNSVLVSSISTVSIAILAAMLAYPLARFTFKLRNGLFYLLVAGLALPAHISLIPILVLLKTAHLQDTYLALIGPYVGFGLPFGVLVLRSFLLTLPRDYENAARLDGLSAHGIFWRIMVPMISPSLAVVVIFSFVSNWNEFLFALTFIQKKALMTLQVGLMDLVGEFTTNWVGISAALTIATIPMLIVYLAFQRQLLTALRFGGLKG
jgi:raffinose/stachyose/melibiose transport system permease protein